MRSDRFESLGLTDEIKKYSIMASHIEIQNMGESNMTHNGLFDKMPIQFDSETSRPAITALNDTCEVQSRNEKDANISILKSSSVNDESETFVPKKKVHRRIVVSDSENEDVISESKNKEDDLSDINHFQEIGTDNILTSQNKVILSDSESEDETLIMHKKRDKADNEDRLYFNVQSETKQRKSRILQYESSEPGSDHGVNLKTSMKGNSSDSAHRLDASLGKKKKYSKKVKKQAKNADSPNLKDMNRSDVPSWKQSLDADVFSSGSSEEELENRANISDEELEDISAIKNKMKGNGMPKKNVGLSGTKKQLEKRKEETLKVYSESQKLQRQAPLSVPYHKPKQRTLQEFLSMKTWKLKPKLGTSLRLDEEDLRPVLQQLQQRDKEIEQFFKPDIEEEDDPNEVANVVESPKLNFEVEDPKPGNRADIELQLNHEETESTPFDVDAKVVKDISDRPSPSVNNDLDISPDKSTPLNSNGIRVESLDLFLDTDDPTISNQLNGSNHEVFLQAQNSKGESNLHTDDLDEVVNNNDNDDDFRLVIESETIIPDSSFNEESCDVLKPSSELSLSNVKNGKLTLSSTKPKLSGRPGEEIEFDEDIVNLNELQERFLKHASAKTSPKKKEVVLNIVKKEVTSDGKEVLLPDVVTFKPEENQETRTNLWQLKGTLRRQLDIKREIEMKKLLEERGKEMAENNEGGNTEPEDNILDLDEDEELSDKDSLEEEEEGNEYKNDFIDGEAEEDEDEDIEAKEGKEESQREVWGIESQPLTDESFRLTLEPPSPSIPGLSQLVDRSTTENVNDEELMALCSGKFETQKSLLSNSQEEEDKNPHNEEGNISEEEEEYKSSVSRVRRRITLDEDDSDGENGEEANQPGNDENEEKLISVRIDSDEEEGKKESRKSRRIVLSDDDDDNVEVEESEASDDEYETKDDVSEEDAEVKDVAYDSDENEIPTQLVNNKGKLRKEFLENEAELSGSELGSGDENEDGLDDYEEDDGDKEEFDENQLRNEVEKIHLKNLLDEDQRDVRLFQEFFLEDGELHTDGPGRQRRFRWANLVDDDNDEIKKNSDDEVFEEEGIDVESWRVQRHEREKFLTESQELAETEFISMDDSQLLMLGKKAIMKSSRKLDGKVVEETVESTNIISTMPESPDLKKTKAVIKRGSFLSFKEDVLTRLAAISKGNPTIDQIGKKGGTSKASCVFATVTPPAAKEADKRKQDKEEATGSTPKRARVVKKSEKPSQVKGRLSSIFKHIQT
ncbi:claspin-like isoform X2 [Artemia franciscana]